MQRRKPQNLADYLGILQRRWHLVVIPLCITVFLTLIVGSRLTKYYRSETVVMLDPQKVPTDLVKSDALDLGERLQLVNQQILSRTQLEKIINAYGLYPKMRGTRDEIIEQMRKDISLEIVRDSRIRDANVTAFRLAYTTTSPKLAQDVTRQLGSLYIEENLRVREQIAEGTHEFIDSELQKARENLQRQEEEMRKFKSDHMGALPEQEASNLQLISQYQGLLQANAEAIARAEQNKQYLQSLLEVNAPKPPEKMQALESLKMELAAAEQKYTPNHPDVIRLKSQIKALEQQQSVSVREMNTPQVSSQLAALGEEIKVRNVRARELESKLRQVQSRVEALPMVEQQFTELNRDYEVSKANYQALLQKRNLTGMTVEMERGAKGENFRILDPASYPQKPIKPNMLQVNLGGFFLGLLLGVALAALREFQDTSIHTETDLAYYVSVPTLATVPFLHTEATLAREKRSRKRKFAIAGVSAISAVIVIAALVVRGSINVRTWF